MLLNYMLPVSFKYPYTYTDIPNSQDFKYRKFKNQKSNLTKVHIFSISFVTLKVPNFIKSKNTDYLKYSHYGFVSHEYKLGSEMSTIF